MIPSHEAQRRLIQAGYTLDLKHPYRELTVLNSRFDDVKQFLEGQDYHGPFVCIVEIKEKSSQKRRKRVEVGNHTTEGAKTRNRVETQHVCACFKENADGQLSLF